MSIDTYQNDYVDYEMDITKVQIKQLEGKSNWLNWKGRVSILLRGTVDALDVVEGKLKRPDEPNEGATADQVTAYQTAHNRYQKADCTAMIIMSTNMSEETYEKVRSLTSARDIWLELHRLFDGVHEDRAYDLCMKFFGYKMSNTDDVATHVGKLKNIWKDLKVELDKEENNDLLLMCRIVETLPSEYFSFVSSWRLLNKAERTVNNLTDQLCSYERALADKTEPNKQEALFAKVSNSKPAPKLKVQKVHKSTRPSTNIICHYCKQPGHIVRNCEKWIADGKPPKPAIPKTTNTDHSSSAHNVSLVAVDCDVFAMDSAECNDAWYVDNGATSHLTFRSDIFASFEKFAYPHTLKVANGNIAEAVGKRTVFLEATVSGKQYTVKLENVWYVPKLRRNLFSVLAAQDRHENSCFISTPQICNLFVNDERVIVGTRDRDGGLFKLVARTIVPPESVEVNVVSSGTLLQLYHERMGHQNKRHVKSVLKRELDVDVDRELCEGCVYGKAHRRQFGTRVRATKPGEVIHTDVCGPFCYSFSNYRYFVLFKDDYSGFRFVYFMKAKSEVPEKLKWMLAECKARGITVTELLSDNGGEFDNAEVQKILHESGIRQRLVMPYTPQQNGCSERENRTLVEAARAMRLAHEELPQALWAELINTAAYILNRTGPSSVEGKTPYELWYNKKPKITHLRVIGCTAYVHVPDQQRKKLDTKAEKGILIGYEGDDGYRIFLQPGNRTCRSRDVVFDEKVITSTTASDWPVNLNADEQARENVQQHIQKHDALGEDATADEEVTDSSSGQNAPAMQLRDRECINKPARYNDFVSTAEAVFSPSEPNSFEAAVHSDHRTDWQTAMENEMQSLQENQTWELVDLPTGKKAISCKWVYKVKQNPDGSIERYKARLVIKGFSQTKGVDYDQTFSPVVRNSTIRTLLSVAASERMHLMQFDVSTAFLYGDLTEEIYMKQPEGFSDNSDRVCKLKRSLYGLKQAPRCWNRRFGSYLQKLGFQQSDADPCLFILEKDSKKLLLALYVDDGIVAATDEHELLDLAAKLKSEFKIVTKPATYFLGVEINQRSDGSVKISQGAYTKKLLDQFGMSECRPCVTPIISSENTVVNEKVDSTETESVKFPYRSAVGALMYLMTTTRPDIAYAVSVVSRKLENPTNGDVVQVKRIFRYLRGTADVGIVYKPEQHRNTLLCYSDADHAGDKSSSRSTTGVVCIYSGGAISWLSQRQSSVAISTTEAEIVAASEAAREVVWLKRLLNELVALDGVPEIQIDNEAAIRLAQNPEYHRRTKHIQTRHFFIREQVAEGEIGVKSVTTELQVADALTKALLGPRLKLLMNKMGLE